MTEPTISKREQARQRRATRETLLTEQTFVEQSCRGLVDKLPAEFMRWGVIRSRIFLGQRKLLLRELNDGSRTTVPEAIEARIRRLKVHAATIERVIATDNIEALVAEFGTPPAEDEAPKADTPRAQAEAKGYRTAAA